ncbi:MAG: hypothetical protein IJ518_05450 [Clostridia bacterium]|nr:hypothetical protein [Clostridia bacterium]
MNKYRLFAVVLCLLLLPAFALTVCADIGPKPSVRVTFANMGDALCYGTLLSEYPSTGPQSVWDGNEEHIYTDGLDMAVWRAFADYEDADGYYFLQIGWQVNEAKSLAWTYYPPDRFKILLYYPETGRFVSSGVCERYAFDTYYTVDMEGVAIGEVAYDETHSTDERIEAYRSYNYRREAAALAVRILLTILIELGIALLFGYRERRPFLLLVAANTVTQVVLNGLLGLIRYCSGAWAFIAWYVMLELVVLLIEAVAFSLYLPKLSEKPRPRWLPAVYAVVANSTSFAAGLFLVRWLPDVF